MLWAYKLWIRASTLSAGKFFCGESSTFQFAFSGLLRFLFAVWALFGCFLRDVLCCEKAPSMLPIVTFAHVAELCGKGDFKRRREQSLSAFF
jgi:hypothetical protein